MGRGAGEARVTLPRAAHAVRSTGAPEHRPARQESGDAGSTGTPGRREHRNAGSTGTPGAPERRERRGGGSTGAAEGEGYVITIGKLAADDRAAWERLFRGYTAFYQEEHPQSMYDRAWAEFQADERLHALGAWLDGSLVGIVHFFPHPRTTG